MSTPLSQFPKPQAEQFQAKRKLFLVPIFAFPPGLPDEGDQILERYWSEVRDHVNNLERSLGTVSHVYHETLFSDGDEGIKLLESLNPKGLSFIQAMCQSTAKLEATEDRALVEESSDWQRCLSVGLISAKVLDLALQSLQEVTQKRSEHTVSRIEETLKEDESGVLFAREDHRIQFPADIQVFYVAPPSLDSLKRWIDDQMRQAPPSAAQAEETQESAQAEEPNQAKKPDESGEPEQPDEATGPDQSGESESSEKPE